MSSDYQSPANLFKSSLVTFKFSINGKDNEMLSGKDHAFNIVAVNGYAETPLISFGEQLKPLPGEKEQYSRSQYEAPAAAGYARSAGFLQKQRIL